MIISFLPSNFSRYPLNNSLIWLGVAADVASRFAIAPSLPLTHQTPPHLTQLNHLHRTLRPVMDPAHQHVAATRRVPMPEKITALILSFHLHFLPRLLVDLAQRHDVREPLLDLPHRKPQPPRHHAKQEQHNVLILWPAQHSELCHRGPKGRPAFQQFPAAACAPAGRSYRSYRCPSLPCRRTVPPDRLRHVLPGVHDSLLFHIREHHLGYTPPSSAPAG